MVRCAETLLVEMLAAMDQHMQRLRETQQGLVATVELACRRALDRSFGRLVLVGSAALRVETPGSDVDVVCFTKREAGQETALGLPVDILRRVHWALKELIRQYSDYAASFSMELIDDARIPILRVLWGPPGHPIAVDMSVDQTRPVDHVRWFQRVGASPHPTAPPPAVAPPVTLTLRCVKWWLKQRQIPRTKEGGLPTLAWLLMAVHVCTLAQKQVSSQRPTAALLASLSAFFHFYSSLDRLDGVLQFSPDGMASSFKRHARKRLDPWAELSVLDPTREGSESLNLAPTLPHATQLLLAYELQRASVRLEQVPPNGEVQPSEGRCMLEEVFEPLPDGTNTLPSFLKGGAIGVLVLCGEIAMGSNIPNIEVALVTSIIIRPGWTAPFLLRSDERSEVGVELLDLEESSGRCQLRKRSKVLLCPCHFICRVRLEKKSNRCWRLDNEGLERVSWMKNYMRQQYASRKENARPPAVAI